MAAFPRAILPAELTPPLLPESLKSWGSTGKGQTRSPLQVGRTWDEFYPAAAFQQAASRGWFAQVQQLWRTGAVFDVAHLAYATQNGAGGGTPLINGATQTGNVIATDGWPNSTAILKAGDLVKLGTLPLVYELTADATSNGSGQANLQVEPIIVAGGSPANNGTILYGASVTFRAILAAFEPGRMDPAGILTGLRLSFREQVG